MEVGPTRLRTLDVDGSPRHVSLGNFGNCLKTSMATAL